MALTCNIDAKGKRLRLINGIVLLIGSLLMAALYARPSHDAVAWGLTIAVFLMGAFCVFEARAGWCVMRAMGFKTKH